MGTNRCRRVPVPGATRTVQAQGASAKQMPLPRAASFGLRRPLLSSPQPSTTLKATLSSKTAELNEKLAELKAVYTESKKIVKLEMDKTAWKEFGIADKH